MTENRNAVMFQFSAPFEINDDNEILIIPDLEEEIEEDLTTKGTSRQ